MTAPSDSPQGPRNGPPPGRARLGLIVNPIAGMGGAVALKGTDDVVDEARERGAQPVAHERALRFLSRLPEDIRVLTCSGPMGEDACREAGVRFAIVLDVEVPTSAEDTREAARRMAEHGLDLVCFLGGDGTALDVGEAIDHEVVCLGVPSGVKMNSAVFAATPEAAADVAREHLAGRSRTHVAEVVEIDEVRMREGEITPAELASLVTPDHQAIQASKAEPGGTLEGVVEAGRELAQPGHTLVLGPGSTTLAIKEALVGEGTLLGVDVIEVDGDGEPSIVLTDAKAEELEQVPADALLILSPIGGQGFVLGRGNQQVTPGLLSRIGWDRLVVVATAEKLRGLDVLRVDTGDPELDASAPERLDVLTGPGFRKRVKLRKA